MLNWLLGKIVRKVVAPPGTVVIAFGPEATRRIQRMGFMVENHDPGHVVARALAFYELILEEISENIATPVLAYPDGDLQEVEI